MRVWDRLKLLSFRKLPGQEEGFWITAVTAKLERAEILVPLTFGDVWLRFHPMPQLVQIVEADVPVAHAFDQMITNSGGKPGPSLDLRHPLTRRYSALLAEDEAAQLITQLLDLIRIIGGAEAFC